MSWAYIALGSNLGDRRQYLNDALTTLQAHESIQLEKTSAFYETSPVGGPPGQRAYLNAVAKLQVNRTPEELLSILQSIEHQFGRERKQRFGPRTLDLDILLFENEVRDSPSLTIPHPRMHEREFVLLPMLEIAPEVVHPTLDKTITELFFALRAETTPDVHSSWTLKGKRAMVTGSTSGIGRAIALELARHGANVIIHGRRSAEQAQLVAKEFQALNVQSEPLLQDLRLHDSLSEFVERAWNVWNGLDIWINNAGADTLTGEAAEWPFEKKLDELWKVDVAATMLLSRLIGSCMQAQQHGVILNMGWDQAETGMEGDSGQLFAATKSAIMAFSKSLALSLAPSVRVNCLAPGWIRTAWGEQASESWQERAVAECPLSRWGAPEDVANVARWLVSSEAAFVTGQIVRVNGGAVR